MTGSANSDLAWQQALHRVLCDESRVALYRQSIVDLGRGVTAGFELLARFDDGKLTLAAADGFRLSIRKGNVTSGKSPIAAVIIPARALLELSRIIGDDDEAVEV
ncbi:MAG: hypothetical protein C4321_07075, partial [Chloroflexota bacterium]